MRFAIANTEIDGGNVTPETKALLDAWAEGDLTDDDLLGASSSLGARKPW